MAVDYISNELFLQAIKKLNLAIDYNPEEQLIQFLSGSPVYSVKTKDPTGELVEANSAKLQALYYVYENDPDVEIDKLTSDSFRNLFSKSISVDGISNALEILKLQIIAQLKGDSKFNLDYQDILSELKKNSNIESARAERKKEIEKMLDDHKDFFKDHNVEFIKK